MHRHPSAITDERTLGQAMADRCAGVIGSWNFLIGQSLVMAGWMLWNGIVALRWFTSGEFDPFPWILLNLCLSTQAAVAGPLILLSQNRQSEVDRAHAENAYAHIDALIGNQDRQHDLLLKVAAVLLVQHKQQSEHLERIEAALRAR